MSTPKLPLLGGEILDLKARAGNRVLRDLCAQVITQRDLYKQRAEAQHATLQECLILLCECREMLGHYKPADPGAPFTEDACALSARITALIGDA